MLLGQSIAAIFCGSVGLLLGGRLLYLCVRRQTSPLRIWWIPKEMEERDTVERLIVGIVATGFTIVGLILIIMGVLLLPRQTLWVPRT
jgi:hypothetical protein